MTIKDTLDHAITALHSAITNSEHDTAHTYASIIAMLTTKSESKLYLAGTAAGSLLIGLVAGHFI